MATVKGYSIGEIPAKGAVTADMILDERVDLGSVVTRQDMDRQTMDLRKGMFIKYVPYLPHPVTGQVTVGGRYLFDTWEDALGYDDWTTNTFEVGNPPEKFWSWSMWKRVDRWTWKVIGAYQFSLPESHGLHRLQRWSYDGENVEADLRRVYPNIRDAAGSRKAAGVWLMYQPDAKLISLLTIMDKPADLTTESVYDAIESLKAQSSLGSLFPQSLNAQPTFDRTSLNISVWLPASRTAGGVEQITPLVPVLPAVQK